MSTYPLVLEGSAISALVVGGGPVAARKAGALLAAGARVHVVAPLVVPELEALAAGTERLRITREAYDHRHLAGSTFVVAATSDAVLNTRIAHEAQNRGLLVNVVDAPNLGNCITPAVHRSGDVVVAVTAGGVPSAAARIRDAIGATIDDRYAEAVHELGVLRRTLIDAGNRDRWIHATRELVGADFCDAVESGRFAARLAAWR